MFVSAPELCFSIVIIVYTPQIYTGAVHHPMEQFINWDERMRVQWPDNKLPCPACKASDAMQNFQKIDLHGARFRRFATDDDVAFVLARRYGLSFRFWSSLRAFVTSAFVLLNVESLYR